MSPSRHDQLISAGWGYDPATDMYTAPGSASDGTAKRYNEAAAWSQFQADQLDSASRTDAPPPVRRQNDPRKQEPE